MFALELRKITHPKIISCLRQLINKNYAMTSKLEIKNPQYLINEKRYEAWIKKKFDPEPRKSSLKFHCFDNIGDLEKILTGKIDISASLLHYVNTDSLQSNNIVITEVFDDEDLIHINCYPKYYVEISQSQINNFYEYEDYVDFLKNCY